MNHREHLAQWQSTPAWKELEAQFYRDKREVARIFVACVRAEYFRVWSEAELVDVILCFKCSELIYLKGGSIFRRNSYHRDDMSLISGQLWDLVEEAFAAR